jgi:hypothetical protein
MHEHDCATICDMIAGTDDRDLVAEAFALALAEDPTESLHAAHIRDAIRDHFDDAEDILTEVRFENDIELTDCPDHGKQRVTGEGTTRGPDPYTILHAACGCSLICMGPGDDNTIISRKGS